MGSWLSNSHALALPAAVSIHQLHQLLAPDVPIRLGRVESAFFSPEGVEFGGGFELPGAADEDSVGGGCVMKVVEEGFFIHAGFREPFFAECFGLVRDDPGDFEATDQGHSRAGDIDEDEVARADLGADAAEFDGFSPSEDEVRIFGLDGH